MLLLLLRVLYRLESANILLLLLLRLLLKLLMLYSTEGSSRRGISELVGECTLTIISYLINNILKLKCHGGRLIGGGGGVGGSLIVVRLVSVTCGVDHLCGGGGDDVLLLLRLLVVVLCSKRSMISVRSGDKLLKNCRLLAI